MQDDVVQHFCPWQDETRGVRPRAGPNETSRAGQRLGRRRPLCLSLTLRSGSRCNPRACQPALHTYLRLLLAKLRFSQPPTRLRSLSLSPFLLQTSSPQSTAALLYLRCCLSSPYFYALRGPFLSCPALPSPRHHPTHSLTNPRIPQSRTSLLCSLLNTPTPCRPSKHLPSALVVSAQVLACSNPCLTFVPLHRPLYLKAHLKPGAEWGISTCCLPSPIFVQLGYSPRTQLHNCCHDGIRTPSSSRLGGHHSAAQEGETHHLDTKHSGGETSEVQRQQAEAKSRSQHRDAIQGCSHAGAVPIPRSTCRVAQHRLRIHPRL